MSQFPFSLIAKCGAMGQNEVTFSGCDTAISHAGCRGSAMANDSTFAKFIRRIRSGDQQAAAELVQQFEPAIRLEIRMRLSDPHLRRTFDSMDICQSVLASFFVRAASGQYDLDEPGQLRKLLVGIARNKVAFQARRQRAKRRDHRRNLAGEAANVEAVANSPSPSRQLAGEELLREFRDRLTEQERCLADLRAQGRQWAEIAAEVGGTPQALRKQLARAVERVIKELGLEEYD
jgi:RNA polymerase sigma-70 factor (ECF subfamily)